MFCRAHMLLQKEYFMMQKNPIWGIEAHPCGEDNFLEWTAKISGLKDTVWESGIFVVSLQFCGNYNQVPPSVFFHTIPFHPNIDMKTGKPCIDVLQSDQWFTSHGIHHILATLQVMLSNPILENAVNDEAANVCKQSPELYRQVVQDCVNASRRIDAGLDPHKKQPTNGEQDTDQQHDGHDCHNTRTDTVYQPARLSFDDYHTTWSGIATSKASPNMKNPLLEAIRENQKLQTAHFGLPIEELHEHMKKQLEEHNSLMYGKFGTLSTKADSSRQQHLETISKMKKIYLPKKKVPPPSVAASEVGEPWDKDADDLLEWTNSLDEDSLQ
ncbi:ubiquitin-conjugating enzyme E2 U-like [Anneissia japonica]|uniref:ubiquitin-conjugating enzyme E2 U-like n=1 Tax=Anneissia japonica TaxID=1529436 RepID=UPI001425A8C4|nr:ubiquitin-conjugating enzyme E2 U-like [Anneissia japonica]XP_033097081.1 ubiquitin-conjugating enzyme E2 U-like [Anneissia japonica]XP_033097082.1 ubiquitin-conjugating enzyme E2 U-like [Anneissia japonica]